MINSPTEKELIIGGFMCLCTHQIPGLMSLKRYPSVVFVGIDTLDDIRNNSYNELFVSGGCIVSDELLLNPDFITTGRSGIRIQQQHPAKCHNATFSAVCFTLILPNKY